MSAAITLAVALVCWPPGVAGRRLDASGPARGRPEIRPAGHSWAGFGWAGFGWAGFGWAGLGWAGRRPPLPLLAVLAVPVGLAAAGPGGAVATLLVLGVAVRAHRAARATRERAATTRALAEALGSFAAELRAGAPPAAAARAAARDGDPRCTRILALVEATDRLGGDVPAAVRSAAAALDRRTGDDLRRFAAAWALADRHGIGLAGPVAAVAVDLRARSRFAGRLSAQVAGPRATAVVLAVLPVLGVVLGEGIGARPWAVLSGSGAGQVLLVVGVALVAAGVEWTERIVAGVVR